MTHVAQVCVRACVIVCKCVCVCVCVVPWPSGLCFGLRCWRPEFDPG